MTALDILAKTISVKPADVDTLLVTNTTSDGPGSLRAAWEQALLLPNARIAFSSDLDGASIDFDETHGPLVTPSTLASSVSITIDGDVDGDGLADITLDGYSQTHFFENVSSGATLKLENLVLTRAFAVGDTGVDGTPGIAGTLGGQAGDGASGGDAAAILNAGNLVIENVSFAGFDLVGGKGGNGGNGANGGKGHQPAAGTGNTGGAGGDGGNGGAGGNAAGIISSGIASISHVQLLQNNSEVFQANIYVAKGGNAGNAGNGGTGGAGSDGGDLGGDGGRGGKGGDGGDGGDGGVAALLLVTDHGSYDVSGIAKPQSMGANLGGGVSGTAGNKASGGPGGEAVWSVWDHGSNGSAGDDGRPGSVGGAGEFVLNISENGATSQPTSHETLIFLSQSTAETVAVEGETVTFHIVRIGDTTDDQPVTWNIIDKGPDGASTYDATDFVGNTLPGGTVTFDDPNVNSIPVSFDIKADSADEDHEYFQIQLVLPADTSDTSSALTAVADAVSVNEVGSVTPNVGLGRAVLQGIMVDDDGTGGPQFLGLTNDTVMEKLPGDTVIGYVEAVDPNNGPLTVALDDNPYIKLVDSADNKVALVTKATLDFDDLNTFDVGLTLEDLLGQSTSDTVSIMVQNDGRPAGIPADIELPYPADRLGLPNVALGRIVEGTEESEQPRKVLDFAAQNLDGGEVLEILGGPDSHLFDVAADGRSLMARQPFDVSHPDDGALANVMSVQVGLRRPDGRLFDETRVYIGVVPEEDARQGLIHRLKDLVDGLGDVSRQEAIAIITDVASKALVHGADNLIWGTPQEDLLEDTAERELIYGLSGDDRILMNGESNMVDGGDGHDTVVYHSLRDDYRPDLRDDGRILVYTPDGDIDTLMGIERVEFDDGAFIYDFFSHATSVVHHFYQAALGRAPDEEGLKHWTGLLDAMTQTNPTTNPVNHLARHFLEAPEHEALYGAAASNEDYVHSMYQYALGRPADQAGSDFWVDSMQHGLGRDDVLVAFALSAEAAARFEPDYSDGVWVV